MLHPSMVEALARSYQAGHLAEAKRIGLLKQTAGRLETRFSLWGFGWLSLLKGPGKQKPDQSSLQTVER